MAKNNKKLLNGITLDNYATLMNNFNNNQVYKSDTLQFNARYDFNLTINWQHLISFYSTYSFIKNFIDIPVDDAFSKGYNIVSNELDENDIISFKNLLDEKNVIEDIKQTLKYNRLFGGAGILINEIEKENWEMPFNIDNIKENEKIKIYSVHRWELNNPNNYDNLNQILDYQKEMNFSLRDKSVHPSRFFKIRNGKIPYPYDAKVQGWGLSEIEKVLDSVNMFIKTKKVLFELLDEAKIDVYKIDQLLSNIQNPEAQATLHKRMNILNSSKNYQNAIVLDKADEWEQKTMPFSGWAEILRELRIDLCSSLNIPATKLFGVALTSGLGMSNEGDMDNYNLFIDSNIRNHAKKFLLFIVKVYMKSFFGFIPDDLQITFPSLKNLSEAEIINNKVNLSTIYFNLYDRGLLELSDLETALTKEDIIKIKLTETNNYQTNPIPLNQNQTSYNFMKK